MDTKRLDLPADEELDSRSVHLLGQVPPLNVARMLTRTGVAPEFYACLSAMFAEDWFPATDREVILFRTCRDNDSAYPIAQHRAFGVPPAATVDAVLSDELGALDPWHQALCRMSDEMASAAKLSEESVLELVGHYCSQNAAARAIFVMSWFNMLTRYVDSTGVPVESGPNAFGDITGPTGVN